MSEDYDFSDTDCDDRFPSAAVVIGCIIAGLAIALVCAVLP